MGIGSVKHYRLKGKQFKLNFHVQGFLEALKSDFLLQKEHIYLWIPVLFALGISLYFALPSESSLWPPVFVILFSVSLLYLNITILYRNILILFLIISAGFIVAQFQTYVVHTPMLGKALGPVMLEGRLKAVETLEGGEDRRVVLTDLNIERLAPVKTPRTVRLRYRGETNTPIGARVRGLVRLMPLSSPVLPGGFDFQRFFFFKSIGAVGFVYNDLEIVEQSENVFYTFIEGIRHRTVEKIYNALSGEQAPVVAALITGERAGITEADQEAMRSSGLAHMLAISGLHLGLVSGVIFFAVRLGMAVFPGFAVRHPIKKYAAVAGLIGAFIYMVLAGATIPTQRAMIMTGAVFAAILLDRSPFSLRLVAFAALIVLFFSPDSLLSASFQMSFSAVTALVWFYEQSRIFWMRAYRRAGIVRKAALYFIGLITTTVIASLATAPFALYHFQKFALYGLAGNILAMPVLGFWVMPMAVLSMLAMLFGLEYWPLQIMGQGVEVILGIARDVSALPGAVYRISTPPFPAFLLFVAAGLLALFLKGRLRAAALVPLTAAVFIFTHHRPPDVMVSANHSLTGIYDGTSLMVSNTRRERFVAGRWAESLGMKPDTDQPLKNMKELTCDDYGCRFYFRGQKISLLNHPGAHEQDCAWADLLIASDPVYVKCAATTIDKFNTWANGAHAVWLDKDRMKIKMGRKEPGLRPWYADQS